MKISELQSLMAHNRAAISNREHNVYTLKRDRKYFAENGDQDGENFCNKHLQITKKKIAKLVAIQKSLKREIKDKVEREAKRNRLNRYTLLYMQNYGDL